DWDNLGFEPTCPRELLERQLSAMGVYAGVLRKRASLEGVELPDVR
ncbi:crAss001_48 related protein, partial [Parafannyhessea umbonata]